jgi:small conductance mechanosensitive channel
MNDWFQPARDFYSAMPLADIWRNTAFRILLTILVLALIQIIVHRSLNRIVERIVRSHKYVNRVEEHKREATLKSVFRTGSAIFIWIVGFIVILWLLHVNLSALLTSAGLIGVVAGLGGQSVIKDWLAGMFIIIENQLRVDDIVTIAAPTATVSGLVEEVNLRTTRLRDLDGNLHILNNGSIGVITNMSFSFAQVNIDIKISYDTDVDLIEKLIKEAGQSTAHKKQFADCVIDPIEMLRVDNLGESAVTIKALGKVKPGTQWDVAGDFRRNLKKLFDEHRVAAPYANIVVQMPKPAKAKAK